MYFGKWCRPNYNSVVATFCNNIANEIPIHISDPDHSIELIYIDDVISSFIDQLTNSNESPVVEYCDVTPSYTISLNDLAEAINQFKKSRKTLLIPNFGDPFLRKLYATYISYLSANDFSYPLDIKSDNRGCLAEFIKSPSSGQAFYLPHSARYNKGKSLSSHES